MAETGPSLAETPTKIQHISAEGSTVSVEQSLQEFLFACFQKYREQLFRVLNRLLQNEQDAAETLQETFLHLTKHSENMDEGHMKNRLFMTARNIAMDVLRKRNRVHMLSIHIPLEHGRGTRGDLLQSREERDDPEEDLATMRGALAELSKTNDPFLLAVRLHYLEEQTYEQVANTMHTRTGTAQSRVYKGIRKLRMHMRLDPEPTVPRDNPRSIRRSGDQPHAA